MAWKNKYNNPMAGRWCVLYKGTEAELILEDAIAALGIPYRTQFPLFIYGSRFFPDFVLPTLQLVIEVDDDSHSRKSKRAADEERSQILKEKYGWRVIRCTNAQVKADPSGTLQRILTDFGEWPITEGIRSLKVRDFLPNEENMPKADKRKAKSDARQRRRGVKTKTTKEKK